MISTYSSNSNPYGDLTYNKMIDAMNFIISNQPAPPPLKIITNPILTEPFQTFIPRSKKKRVVKKCKKKYTIQVPSRSGYLLKDENTFVCHPTLQSEVFKILKDGGLLTINEILEDIGLK